MDLITWNDSAATRLAAESGQSGCGRHPPGRPTQTGQGAGVFSGLVQFPKAGRLTHPLPWPPFPNISHSRVGVQTSAEG